MDINEYYDTEIKGKSADTIGKKIYTLVSDKITDGVVKDFNESIRGFDVRDDITKLSMLMRAYFDKVRVEAETYALELRETYNAIDFKSDGVHFGNELFVDPEDESEPQVVLHTQRTLDSNDDLNNILEPGFYMYYGGVIHPPTSDDPTVGTVPQNAATLKTSLVVVLTSSEEKIYTQITIDIDNGFYLRIINKSSTPYSYDYWHPITKQIDESLSLSKNGKIIVDFESYPSVNYMISGNSNITWLHVNESKSKIIPVDGISKIKITTGLEETRFLFLTDDKNISSGTNAHVVYGYINRPIAPESSGIIYVPLTAKYLVLWETSSLGNSRLPESLTLYTNIYDIINEIKIDKIGNHYIYFADYDTIPYSFNHNSNIWIMQGKSKIIPVKRNTRIRITTGSNITRYIFLIDLNSMNHNTPANSVNNMRCVQVDINDDVLLDVPANAKYLCIWEENTNGDARLPETVYIYDEIGTDIADLKVNNRHTCFAPIFNYNLSNEYVYTNLIGYNSDNILVNGYSPNPGFDNKVTINKYIVSDNVSYKADIHLNTSNTGVCTLGTVDSDFTSSKHATIIKFDFTNAKIEFLTASSDVDGANYDGKTLPGYTYFETYLENLSGTEYRIEIGRINRCPYAKVYNLTTSKLCGFARLFIYETDSSYGKKAGALYDFPTFSVLSGNIVFKRIAAFVPTKIDIAFLGDSITEGSQLAVEDAWANKVISHYGNGLNLGRGGGNIDHMIRCASDILPAVRPKYVVVTIGTNGGNTVNKLATLIDLITSIDAIPIINTIPMKTTSVQSVNNMILAIDTEHVRFDIATAVNNDIAQGQDSSLFATDHLHPNKKGGIAMYNRFIADVGWE